MHLLRRGAGVGVDRHGAQFTAGSPGDEKLRAVLQVDQHPVALFHSARRERGGDTAYRIMELRVAVGRRRAVEGLPDQQRLVAMGGGLGCQQPVEVLAGERIAETLRGHVRLDLIVVVLGVCPDCFTGKSPRTTGYPAQLAVHFGQRGRFL
ncbi:hypothetical protein D9M73_238480 [compost metagenome]